MRPEVAGLDREGSAPDKATNTTDRTGAGVSPLPVPGEFRSGPPRAPRTFALSNGNAAGHKAHPKVSIG